MRTVQLPAVDGGDVPAVFTARAVRPLAAGLRFRRSVAELEPLFGDADVVSLRIGGRFWHVGRTPAWTRHVIGSRSCWADLDFLPLGLAQHPCYYAMGGLPGAPPARHRVARRTVTSGGFSVRADAEALRASIAPAVDASLERRSRVLDVDRFTRALFLHATAAAILGRRIDIAGIHRILGWFDRWSKAMSSPLVFAGMPRLPGTPAWRLHAALVPWYGYLASLLRTGNSGGRLIRALRGQVLDGSLSIHEAVGYLATIVFAGTEPPAHTLMWAYTHCVAAGPSALGAVDGQRAEALLWESFRVQPAVNVLVRRISAAPGGYRSDPADVFVVAPPLTHRHSNLRYGLPQEFTPAAAGTTRLGPDEYPGLGTGAHRCVGTGLGMALGREGLLFLLDEALVTRPPDPTPSGYITTRPRRLPTVRL